MATDDDYLEEMLNEIAQNPHGTPNDRGQMVPHNIHRIAIGLARENDKHQLADALTHMANNNHAPLRTTATGDHPSFERRRRVWVWDSPWSENRPLSGQPSTNHVVPRELFESMPESGESYRVPHNEFKHNWEDNPGGSAAYAGDMGVNVRLNTTPGVGPVSYTGYHRAEYATPREALNAYLLGHAKMMQNRADEQQDQKSLTDLLLKDG